MENTTILHLSNYTAKDAKKGDKFLGPWCDPLKFFKDQKDFLCDTHIPQQKIKEKFVEGNKIFDLILDELIISLNKYHSKKYSNSFWILMLSNWLTLVIDTLNFYYNCLYYANSMNVSYRAVIDESYFFNKLSDVFRFEYKNEYIHSLISFLIKHGNFENISFSEQAITENKDTLTAGQDPIKSFLFGLFKRSKAKKLSYGIAGMSRLDIVRLFYKSRDYSQSFKNYNTNYNCNVPERNKFTFHIESSDNFISLLCKFIEKNLPTTVLDNLSLLIENSNDYINKEIIIASSGLYHDEQLIELALAKELNNAIIFQVHEAGNGLDKYSSSSKYLYRPIDFYLTWGFTEHTGYSKKFIPSPSRLSTKKNIHKEKFESILYFTKFPYMYPNRYDSGKITNWNKYFNNRVKFIKTINNTQYKNQLILKMHHSKVKGFDEEKIMQIYDCRYNNYNNKNLKISNTAILYVDYLSASIYEAMAYNVPVFMCIDYDIQTPTEGINDMLKKFKEIKIAFDTPDAAAMHIENIYEDRVKFWNSREVQNVREKFMERYLLTSPDWIGSTFDTINRIHSMESRNFK